ncbi:hypothetical protein CIPAW_15G171600 [Carya illinoinensis]|uniref:GH18 domain-containing protein n=1 Tax=Carya illinoinensis TaxID=32201 RepID=A0A8T1N8J3_CARIL|nr:hypothetical protein CIPAW_15G171600 [Carya illinoinensis]
MSKTLTMASRKLVSIFLAIFIVAEIALPSPCPSSVAFPIPSSGSVNGIKSGYWLSSLAEKFSPSLIFTSYFTHLFYAFVMLNATTYQLVITQPDDQWMGYFAATLHAKTPRANVFLSIGGAAAGLDTFAIIARTPREPGSLHQLFHYGVKQESCTSGKPRLLLSAAVYFASSFFLSNITSTYPAEVMKKYLDFVSPNCYDYHGSWDTSVTGAHALLYDKGSNISTSYGISTWIEVGIPPEKLVMGMPLYGRTWQLKSPGDNGIGAPAVGVGTGKGFMTYSDIVDFNAANDSNVVYDAQTVSTYSYSGTNWIGYDGPESIEKKVEFARAEGLGGYFFWALGYDDQN